MIVDLAERVSPAVRRHVLTAGRFLVGIGVLVYMATAGFFEFSDLLGLLERWRFTLLGFGGLLAVIGLVALRLKILLSAVGYRVAMADAVRLTVLGLYFNHFLPSSVGGDAVKIYFAAAGNQGAGTELGTVVLVDRITGAFALLVWPVLAAPLFGDLLADVPVLRTLIGILGLTAAGAALVFAFLSSGRLGRWRWVSTVLDAVPGGSHVERILDTMAGYRGDVGGLLAAVGVSLMAHTLTVGVVLCVAESVLPGGMTWEMALVVPLGLAANVVPVTPGGLGVGEAALESLFTLIGLEGGAELVLGWRVLLLVASLWGLVVFLRGRQQSVHQPPGPGPQALDADA